MQFLKGLAISILSFIFFLALFAFGLVFSLNQTLLNSDFVADQINQLDLSALAKEMYIDPLSQDIGQQIAGQFPGAEPILNEILNDTMTDLEPWIKAKANEVVTAIYEYLVGNSQSLNVTISLAPVKDILATNMRAALLDSPPPQLAMAPPEMREMIVRGIEQGLTQQMPPSFTVDESMIPTDVRDTVSQYVGYLKIAYPALIGIMVAIALLITLLHRSVKGATRNLGSTLLIYGIMGFALILASDYFMGSLVGMLGLPPVFQDQLPQLVAGASASMQPFNIGVAAAGLALIIVSIVYPKKEPAE